MAFATQILEINPQNAFPTLRLRLTNRAAELNGLRPGSNSASMLSNWRQKLEDLFTRAGSDVELDQAASQEATEKNKAKIRAMFDKMKANLDSQREDVLREMDRLPPSGQEDVITFWQGATNFLTDVLGWLQQTFQVVVEKLRQGLHLIKEAVLSLFETVKGWLDQIFN